MLLNGARANAEASEDRASQVCWWLPFPATDLAVFAILAAAPVPSPKMNKLCVISLKERPEQCKMPGWGLAVGVTFS